MNKVLKRTAILITIFGMGFGLFFGVIFPYLMSTRSDIAVSLAIAGIVIFGLVCVFQIINALFPKEKK